MDQRSIYTQEALKREARSAVASKAKRLGLVSIKRINWTLHVINNQQPRLTVAFDARPNMDGETFTYTVDVAI